MKLNKALVLMLTALFFGYVAKSQTISNKGKEFWVGYGHHQFMEDGSNTQEMVLYLSTDAQAAQVTVTIYGAGNVAIPATQWKRVYNIAPYTVISTGTVNANTYTTAAGIVGTMPKTGSYDCRLISDPPPVGSGGAGIFNKRSILITSDVPIVAYAHIYGSAASGATMLLPTEAWGYTYVSLNSKQSYSSNCYNWTYIIASQDNTVVEITPSVLTRAQDKTGLASGVTKTISLSKGQIYQLVGANDGADANGNGGGLSTGKELSGTKIKSIVGPDGTCKPIAVFAGSSRTANPASCGSGGGDNDNQQLFPQHTWGKRYLTTPFSGSSTPSSFGTSTYKIAVSDPTSVVKRNGVTLTGLINGNYYQFESNTADYIESDKPIMMCEYMTGGGCLGTGGLGDPEMVVLSPIEQAVKRTVFYRNSVENITVGYLTLTVPTQGLASLKIDASSVFDYTYAHPNKAGYTVVVKRWTGTGGSGGTNKGQSIATCDSGFTAITYGMGSVESYAYNAGTNLENLSALPGFHNTPDTSGVNVVHPNTFVNTPTQLGAYIAYKPTTILWKLTSLASVATAIPPPLVDVTQTNPIAADSIIIGSAKYYLYKLPGEYLFSTAGTYYLPLALTSPNPYSGGCSNQDNTQIAIIVKAKPTASFTYLQGVGCGLDSVKFTSASTTPEGYTIIKRKWFFTSNAADTSNLQNPSFYFPTAGTYPVKLEIITQYGGISSITINVNVAAGSKPHSAYTAVPTTICVGQQVVFTPTSSVAGTTGWYWDFGFGTPQSISSNAVQNITYNTAGTYEVKHTITSASFSCPADTVKTTIIVAATPAISGSSAASPSTCGGNDGSISLTGLLNNTPYTVYYTNGSLVTQTLTSNASGVLIIPNLSAGTYTSISVKIGSCPSNVIASQVVTDPAAPAAPTATGTASVCAGGTLYFTSSTSSSGVISYTWTGPNGFTSTDQNPSITFVTTAATGTYNVVAKRNGCTSPATPVTVTVNAIPVIGVPVGSNPTTCATSTGSITLPGLLASTSYSVSYNSSTGVQTATITSNASGAVVITNLAAGTYSNITVSLNTCESSAVGPISLSDPTPPATPVASVLITPICAGSTLNFTATSATAGVSFEWSGPNSYTATGPTPSITGATVLATGNYTVTAKLNGCTSLPSNAVSVVVNAIPSTPTITSNSPICAGTDLNLVANSLNSGTLTYNWTGPNGFSLSNSNATPSITGATTAATGNYNLTISQNGCTSAAATPLAVTVNAVPVIGVPVGSNPTTCATSTGSITLPGLVASTSYLVSYTSSAGVQTATITSNTSGAVVITNLAAGNYSNITVSANNCLSSAVGPISLSDPTPPATPVVSVLITPVCAGSTLNFTATSATAGVSFEWSGPNSFAATGASPFITGATVAATGSYTVIAKLNGCTSLTSNAVSVVVNAIPATPTISSNSPICAGSNLNLTATSGNSGILTYNWTGPNSFSLSNSNATPTITGATVAATGNYNLTITQNGCTSAAASPLAVVVNAVPVISTASITNTTTCATATGSIKFVASIPSVTYSVTYNAGSTPNTVSLTASSTGQIVIPNLSAGTYSNISVTLNNCSSNTIAGPFTVTDPTPPATPTIVSNNSPVCSGNQILLTASSTETSPTFSWTKPDGTTVTGSSLTINNAATTDGGVYAVKVTVNSCSSASVPATVVVKPTPVIITTPSTNPTACATATGTITLTGLTAATTYSINYKKNSVAQTALVLTANASGNVTIINLTSGTYSNITATLNGCTSAEAGPVSLADPNPPATPTIATNPALTVCSGTNLVLTASSTTAGVTYNWTGPNSFAATNTATVTLNNIAASNAGSYSVTATLNSCTSAASLPATVVVNATPVISNTSFINPTNCNTNTGSIKFKVVQTSTSFKVIYTKNAGIPDTVTISSDATGFITIPSLGAGTYSNISVLLGSCPSNNVGPFTLVDPAIPNVSISANNSPLCEGGTLTVTAASTTSGVSFAWTSTTGYAVTGNIVSIASVPTTASGTYTVTATKNSCTATANANVVVNPNPVVDFTPSAFVCMPNGVVSFTNNSSIVSGTLSYAWNFGDNGTSTATNATHVYTASGNYPVKLTATAATGCSKFITKTFSSFYSKPLANFKVTPDTICQGATNTFLDLSTAPNSAIASHTWNFGDNNSWINSSAITQTKTYALPGTYTVKLVVSNTQGCVSDTFPKLVKVYLQPVIDAGPSFVVPQGTIIKFNPLVNDSTTVTFKWTPAIDFTNANVLRPTLVANKNQIYTLTATGLGKCTATDTLTVKVLRKVTIPNAFSPNGDHNHDTWDIGNLIDYSFATVEVFSRSGQLVYKSNGYNVAWDGTYNGKPLPVATYYYIIDFKGQFPTLSGSVTILR